MQSVIVAMLSGCRDTLIWILCSDARVLRSVRLIALAFQMMLATRTLVVGAALRMAEGCTSADYLCWFPGSHVAAGVVSASSCFVLQWSDGLCTDQFKLVMQTWYSLLQYLLHCGCKGQPSQSWWRPLTATVQHILLSREFSSSPGGCLRLVHFYPHVSVLLVPWPAQGTSVLQRFVL